MIAPAESARLASLFGYLANPDRKSTGVPPNLAHLFKRQTPTETGQPAPNKFNTSHKETGLSNKTPDRVIQATIRNGGNATSVAQKSSHSPLGEDYEFTFKIMMHSISNLHQYTQKLKEFVQESEKKYRPLPDELKPKKWTVKVTMKRRLDTVDEESSSSELDGSTLATFGTETNGQDNYARALKKRCVERRKPVGHSDRDESDRVYDATTSSFDVDRMHKLLQPHRKAIAPMVNTEVEAKTVTDLLEILGEEEEFKKGLKKVNIRTSRTVIVDDDNSDSEGEGSDTE